MSESPELPDEAEPARTGLRPFRGALVCSLLMLAATTGAAIWVCLQLPPDARVPMHWNAAGKIDAYGGRGSLFLLPGVVVFQTLLFMGLPFIEPRRVNLRRSARAYSAVWISSVALICLVQCALVMTALGWRVSMNRLVFGGLGVVFMVIGNFLGKVRSNYFFGVRTPWTLSSELSWNKTHRLAGRLFVALGAVVLLAAVLGASGQAVIFGLLGLAATAVLIPVVYSYFVWRTDPQKTLVNSGTH